MMVALGVVISPILRVEGMCPMAHLINVTCAVMLGPWYALACAFTIGIIRMVCMLSLIHIFLLLYLFDCSSHSLSPLV